VKRRNFCLIVKVDTLAEFWDVDNGL
jgi:hypothetical protein